MSLEQQCEAKALKAAEDYTDSPLLPSLIARMITTYLQTKHDLEGQMLTGERYD